MNKNFFEMVSYAHSKRIYTATSTNAHFLDEENSRKLIESGLDRLIISMDGSTQDTYEQYRRNGNIETVRKGLENIVACKNELKSSSPYIIIQFLVFKHNEDQIHKMKRIVNELGADKLELKSAQVYDYENDDALIPDNKKYSRYVRGADGSWKLKNPIRNRCWRMWSGAVITWDGKVVPCCFDKDAEHQLGKIQEQSFRVILKSKSYNKFRNQILKDRGNIKMCINCME